MSTRKCKDLSNLETKSNITYLSALLLHCSNLIFQWAALGLESIFIRVLQRNRTNGIQRMTKNQIYFKKFAHRIVMGGKSKKKKNV